MGYPPHVLIAFGGTLGPSNAPTEEWSCSIRATLSDNASFNAVEATPAEVEEYLESTAAKVEAMFVNPNAKITSQAKLDYVKVNPIANNGKYRDEVTYGIYDINASGSATSIYARKPFQVSKVITLETGNKRGLANRGRFYLPTPSDEVNLNGTIELNSVDVQVFANFVESLTVETGPEQRIWRAAVVSPKGGTLGRWNPVTGVSIDNVLDTQRRRTRQLPKTRVTVNFD